MLLALTGRWIIDIGVATKQPSKTEPNETKPNQPEDDDDDDDDDDDGNNKVTKKYQTNDHHSQPQLHLASVLSSTHSKVLRKSKLESSLPLYFW